MADCYLICSNVHFVDREGVMHRRTSNSNFRRSRTGSTYRHRISLAREALEIKFAELK